MQTYDLAMLAVLVGTTLFGAFKGLAWQIASLSSLVLSYFIALRFSPVVAPMFGREPGTNRFLAMLVLYIGASLAIWMAFRMVADHIDRLKLREFDRQIGALFGFGKGTLFCTAITLFVVGISPSLRNTVFESRSGHYIAQLLDRAEYIMPAELHAVLDPYLHRLDQAGVPGSPFSQHDPYDRSGYGQPAGGLLGGQGNYQGSYQASPQDLVDQASNLVQDPRFQDAWNAGRGAVQGEAERMKNSYPNSGPPAPWNRPPSGYRYDD